MTNPYAPSAVNLVAATAPAESGAESLIPGGRTCPTGSGAEWISAGWRIFKVQPIMWIVVMIVGTLVPVMLSLIPYVGEVLSMLVTPALMAGYGICARGVLREEKLSIGSLFEGFQKHPEQQLLLGVFYTVCVVGVTALILFITGQLELLKSFYGGELDPSQSLTFSIVNLGAIFIICGAIIFAPYLVHEHGISGWQSLCMSILACLKNIGPFIAYTLLMVLLTLLATVPFALGWLVLLPVMEISGYTAYRDIFIESAKA